MNRVNDEPIDALPACAVEDGAHRGETAPARTVWSAEILDRAAAMLSAAGDPARLRLLDLLAAGERCVSDIAATTGDAMPTVSQRLQLLRREGLVTARRDGKHVFYRLADRHVLELVDNVLRHAGEGR